MCRARLSAKQPAWSSSGNILLTTPVLLAPSSLWSDKEYSALPTAGRLSLLSPASQRVDWFQCFVFNNMLISSVNNKKIKCSNCLLNKQVGQWVLFLSFSGEFKDVTVVTLVEMCVKLRTRYLEYFHLIQIFLLHVRNKTGRQGGRNHQQKCVLEDTKSYTLPVFSFRTFLPIQFWALLITAHRVWGQDYKNIVTGLHGCLHLSAFSVWM